MWNRRSTFILLATVIGMALASVTHAGLVAWWKLDGNYDDSSGNGHHGTLQGGPAFVAGTYGQAVQLTGAPRYIDCGPNVSFRTVSDGGTAPGMSASFWVNRTAGGDQKIFSDIDNTGWEAAGGFKAAIYNNRLEPDIRDSKDRFWSRDTIQTAMDLNRWYHIVIVLDDVADTYTEYLDGVVLRTIGTTQGLAASTVNFYIGRDTPRDTGYVVGMLDDVRIYNHALSAQEVQDVMAGVGPALGLAENPVPQGQAANVYTDATFSWKPGLGAVAHDVYLGTSLDQVTNATRTAPLGVLASQAQDANSLQPANLLIATEYYWRVDEVQAGGTINQGIVWSFSTEPAASPIQNVMATASSADAGKGPENTINGAGLDLDGLHGPTAATMWLTAPGASAPAWIQYDFDRVYKLHEMLVWNYNVQFENLLGYGCKNVTVEYSADGTTWTTLGSSDFTQAPGKDSYAGFTVAFGGVAAQAVRFTINNGWGTRGQYGLSEVRFLQIPVFAQQPQPADGAVDVALDAAWSWRAGREAASHQVYLSPDLNAVMAGTALVDTVADNSYAPADLNLGTTYYWRIDEVNLVEPLSTWEGNVWNFTTVPYVTVDDFESYTDDDGGQIYSTWKDGWGTTTNGAQVGYESAPFAERAVVHGGLQSMPLAYKNVDAIAVSEAQRTWDTPQDWTAGAADTLSLYVRGNPPGFIETWAGSFTISGVGADIFAAADQCRLVYKQLTGDGWIIARVDSLVDVDPWSLAGVMIRQTAEPDSPFAGVFLTGNNGVRFRTRALTAAAAASDTAVATAAQIALREPVWIKLERTGSRFTASYATDATGANWTAMSWGPQAVSRSGPVLIGLAVCSHVAATPTTAEFTGVSTSNSVSGSWQTAEIGIAQPANTPDQLYVTLKDGSNHAQTVPAAPDAVLQAAWNQWQIPFSAFAGVEMSRIKSMIIGVGDRANPQHGSGSIFIDDIKVGRPIPTP